MERLFTLDAQLLFDAIVTALSTFFLFAILSYLFFRPVRNLLEQRKQRIAKEIEAASLEKEEAIALKKEYEQKMRETEQEVQDILNEARQKALQREANILAQAKEEALCITDRANAKIELDKKDALDKMKQQIITIAVMMAQKVVAVSVDAEVQERLFDETLKEMREKI